MPEQSAKGTTILIIDDTPANVMLLEAIFQREGFLTLAAGSGSEGRHIARSALPDLILLDVMMPDEDGFETCEKLKADPVTVDIPVIFITALSEVSHKVKGLSIGGVDYITKPFNKDEVLARARLHIKLRQASSAVLEQQLAKLRQLHEAQEAILPQPDDFPGANFSAHHQSVHEAGGDFYDVIRVGNDIFCYCVADVSGHDIGSSYTTAALKALLGQNASSLFTPQDTMKIVNKGLCSFLKDGQHVTACYGQLNRLLSQLTIINCGHVPPVYLHRDTGKAEALQGAGDILGVFDPVVFQTIVMKTKSGDRFFLSTDGLIEDFAAPHRGRGEGMRDLISACTATAGLPLAGAIREITKQCIGEKKAVHDDIILLGVEI